MTENQKRLARWLIEVISNGQMTESFALSKNMTDTSIEPDPKLNASLSSLRPGFPLEKGSLEALSMASLLIPGKALPNGSLSCYTVTGNLYQAVASDFTGSDRPINAPTIDRLHLIQTLNALPGPQFDELLFALNPPSANVPGNAAPQGSRSKALLEWIESPIGPGLPELEAILGSIIAMQPGSATQTSEQSQTVETLKDIIKTLTANQVPKYDFRGAQFGGGFAETVEGDQIGSNQASE